LSIVLPAFNEEAVVGTTILALVNLGLTSYEIIVIDDGSTDATARVALAAGARVIRHPYNMGNGAAVKSGIRASRGLVIGFMDADGQHDPRELVGMLPLIAKYHMVIGARQRSTQTDWHRNLANFCYNRIASVITGTEILDLTSGMRIIRREDAQRFVDMLPNTFSYPTTITLAFLRSGRSVAFSPITIRRRVGVSKIRIFRDGSRFFLIILKIAMAYSPFRVFFPISGAVFGLGLLRYGYTYLENGTFTNMSQLLMNSAVIIFMLGLIAEQIASLRLEKGDSLYSVENPDRYKIFESEPPPPLVDGH
jgi:glycosyltransferase involved in cell wall biosynthesis